MNITTKLFTTMKEFMDEVSQQAEEGRRIARRSWRGSCIFPRGRSIRLIEFGQGMIGDPWYCTITKKHMDAAVKHAEDYLTQHPECHKIDVIVEGGYDAAEHVRAYTEWGEYDICDDAYWDATYATVEQFHELPDVVKNGYPFATHGNIGQIFRPEGGWNEASSISAGLLSEKALERLHKSGYTHVNLNLYNDDNVKISTPDYAISELVAVVVNS